MGEVLLELHINHVHCGEADAISPWSKSSGHVRARMLHWVIVTPAPNKCCCGRGDTIANPGRGVGSLEWMGGWKNREEKGMEEGSKPGNNWLRGQGHLIQTRHLKSSWEN